MKDMRYLNFRGICVILFIFIGFSFCEFIYIILELIELIKWVYNVKIVKLFRKILFYCLKDNYL